MKKLTAFLFALMLAAVLPLGVFAATGLNANEKAILEKLQTSIYIGTEGEPYQIPESYINTAKNYFSGSCDISDQQKAVILQAIDEGIAIVKSEAAQMDITGNSFKLSNMSEAARSEVLALGQEACACADLQLRYSPSTQEVIITEKGSNTPIFENSAVIKTTGQIVTVDAAFICSCVAICLVMTTGILFLVSKRNGLLEK